MCRCMSAFSFGCGVYWQWSYDLTVGQYSPLVHLGTPNTPTPRAGTVGASLIMLVSGMYYLYGGSDGVDTFADVWQYNIAINTWLYINAKTTNTQQPAPERHFHFAYARTAGSVTKMYPRLSSILTHLLMRCHPIVYFLLFLMNRVFTVHAT
jgi:hypothetical protein